jgi:antibiotic biosynthesis monooxygenase (ABM) superfamily enzyme
MTEATSATPRTGPVTNAPRAMPSVHRRAVLTWLAVFPAITLVQLVVSPYIGGWPLVTRTFVVTAVAVPLSVYVLVPRLMRLAGGNHRRQR